MNQMEILKNRLNYARSKYQSYQNSLFVTLQFMKEDLDVCDLFQHPTSLEGYGCKTLSDTLGLFIKNTDLEVQQEIEDYLINDILTAMKYGSDEDV